MLANEKVPAYGSGGADAAYDPFLPATPEEQDIVAEETRSIRRKTGGAFLWVALLMVATVGTVTWDQAKGSKAASKMAGATSSMLAETDASADPNAPVSPDMDPNAPVLVDGPDPNEPVAPVDMSGTGLMGGDGGVDGEGGLYGVEGEFGAFKDTTDEGEEYGESPDGESPDGEDPLGLDTEGEDPLGEDPNGEADNGEDPDGEDPDGEEPDTTAEEDGSKKANDPVLVDPTADPNAPTDSTDSTPTDSTDGPAKKSSKKSVKMSLPNLRGLRSSKQ